MKSYKDFVTKQFPKIMCIGKNYIKHVNEMGGTEVPKQPVVFLKPWTSLALNPKSITLPRAKNNRIDHEVELGVFFKKSGKNIQEQDVGQYIGGYFLAIDFTDRGIILYYGIELQSLAKQKGFPWEISKGQDNFCPVSDLF